MFRYPKTIMFFGKTLKNSSKVFFLSWIFRHDALYCCAKHSNIEYQDEIQTLSLKMLLQR